jgi:hypothetical protein
MDLATYMTRFQWDMAKYPIKQSLKNLSDMIAKQVRHMFKVVLITLGANLQITEVRGHLRYKDQFRYKIQLQRGSANHASKIRNHFIIGQVI